MTNVGQITKPDASRFLERRKLLLVPLLLEMPGLPEEGAAILGRYWSQAREHIESMERRLGAIRRVYHEAVHASDDGGLQMIDQMSPAVSAFARTLCRSGASLESTDDRALLEESSDWRRCISIGLMSEKVRSLASEGYEESSRMRYDHIASRIGATLGERETGVLFIGQDHRVQFPADVQVFYVSPPALDEYRRWAERQMRSAPPAASQGEDPAGV